MEPHISRSVKAVVTANNAYIEKRINLKLESNDKYIGFVVHPPDKMYFENIAKKFVDEVKSGARKDSKESKLNQLRICFHVLSQELGQSLPIILTFKILGNIISHQRFRHVARGTKIQ